MVVFGLAPTGSDDDGMAFVIMSIVGSASSQLRTRRTRV